MANKPYALTFQQREVLRQIAHARARLVAQQRRIDQTKTEITELLRMGKQMRISVSRLANAAGSRESTVYKVLNTEEEQPADDSNAK